MGNIRKKYIKNEVQKIMKAFDFSMKVKQFDAVCNIIRGKDTLCVLPTSFGKSLIFQNTTCSDQKSWFGTFSFCYCGFTPGCID